MKKLFFIFHYSTSPAARRKLRTPLALLAGKLKLISFACLSFSFFIFAAHAAEFDYSGYGTAGVLEPNWDNPEFIGDFRVRGELKFDGFGIAYAIDELALRQREYAREAIVYAQNDIGRAEIGLTDSIATKLGLGLPDVGGLRLNDDSLLFDKMPNDGPVISNTILKSGRYRPRINLVTAPGSPWQFGASVSGITNKYKFSADVAAKYRNAAGKWKTSLALGASFIDSPENFQTDAFMAPVTADFRAQVYGGMNVQYNSFVWGLTLRGIMDQNEIGPDSDGFAAGTGLSYDILNYSVSASYMVSMVNDYWANTGATSFRYKYDENFDLWMSGGMTADAPFVSAGLRVTF